MGSEKKKAISPPSVISTVDSILYQQDYGPVSKLLPESNMTGSYEQQDYGPVSKLHAENNRIGSASGTMQTASRSPGRGFSHGGPGSFKDVEEEIFSLSVVEKLRGQLNKAKADQETERAIRKRKEKSLVKIAKELNSRSAESAAKEKKIEEVRVCGDGG